LPASQRALRAVLALTNIEPAKDNNSMFLWALITTSLAVTENTLPALISILYGADNYILPLSIIVLVQLLETTVKLPV
jgi:hypothetical protein